MNAAIPAMTHDPDLVAILRTYNDVTERLKRSHETLLAEVARLGGELQEKNRALERRERLAALGEMAAGVAHEIRNPLGGIGLYASLLERDLCDRPEQQDVARRISAGVQNLEHVIRDILAFAGDGEPRLARVCLGTVLDEVVAQTESAAQARSARVFVDPALGELELSCDSTLVERALLNLVFNALDAVGEAGRVWIRLGERGEREEPASIVVEDDGPGIGQENLHRVFNPFFTTKDHGTGLGLAIVHRIAEAHGGSVTVRNRPEGGACFVLSLPAALAPLEARSSRRVGPARSRPRKFGPRTVRTAGAAACPTGGEA